MVSVSAFGIFGMFGLFSVAVLPAPIVVLAGTFGFMGL